MPQHHESPKRRSSPSTNHGLLDSVSRYWERSYAADYLGFVLLLTAYILRVWLTEPFHRMFSLDNLSIQYPHADVERVSVFYNIAYSVFCPLILVALWAIALRPPFHKLHVTILGLIISIVLACFLTDVIKNSVGRPRPDLIARCKPKKDTPEHQLVTIDVCTETDHHLLHDGWRSFPSGHSSLAFSGLGFLAMFFAGQMHVFRPQTDLARVLIALAPLIGAALIAISRLDDYRHDVYDVTVGSSIGLLIAYFSYTRYYPRLQSSRCETPYSSRAELATALKPKDEEARLANGRSWSCERTDDEAERMPLRETSRSGRTSGI